MGVWRCQENIQAGALGLRVRDNGGRAAGGKDAGQWIRVSQERELCSMAATDG